MAIKLDTSNHPSAILNAYKYNQDKLKEYQLLIEYRSLKHYAPVGVYVLPQLNNIKIWQGVIFIRQGLYKGGVFRFKIEIPENYPTIRPSVFFHTYVFHPLIHPETGELALGPQFPLWRPGKDFIFCILGYIKKIFYFKDTWTMSKYVLNSQALYIYTQDERMFNEEARRCVLACEEDEESNTKNPFRFTNFNAFHKKILDVLRKNPNDPGQFMRWFNKTFNAIS
ncbi:unnamed protein product [Blepharisma stoltei]|uniref:UBC core domain-containing protein n=1 Tax=Blepharisma stoltei TaxID=1481888 RepID=A0AAU9K1U4_9CILI|nr:unnamed protein product [Blepharisma stoltei]